MLELRHAELEVGKKGRMRIFSLFI